MAQINLKPCMAYDAICYLQQRFKFRHRNMFAEELAFIEKINALTDGKLGSEYISMANLNYIISSYTYNQNIENYTLSDLMEIFKNPEDISQVVRSKETSEFTASYIFPMLDWLCEEWAQKYYDMLLVLKEVGFEELWKSDVLPEIEKDIEKKSKSLEHVNIDALFGDICKLKQCEPFSEATIYVSYLSCPVSFALFGNTYLSSACGNEKMLAFTAHELMHGFATNEVTKLYVDYVNSNEYLAEKHSYLVNSGDEEEFVMAAEYYLCMKHGGYSKDEILRHARKRYNGCVPNSVFIFDLLSKEKETPDGYAQWLIKVFTDKRLPQGDIEKALNEVAPLPASEMFWGELFGRFQRIIAKIEQIQNHEYTATLNLSKLEEMTGAKFIEIDEKRTLFCQGEKSLPHAKTIRELNKDKLCINIAEYDSHEDSLLDNIEDRGSQISPTYENGCAIWFVNMASTTVSPVAFGATFIKDAVRFTVTLKCDSICKYGAGAPDDVWLQERIGLSKELFAAQQIVEDIYIAI